MPDAFTEALAAMYKCETENILLGCGSTQILRSATHAFTSPTKPLLLSAASYEECPAMARTMGTTVDYVPMTESMTIDVEAVAAKAKGAGLVFVEQTSVTRKGRITNGDPGLWEDGQIEGMREIVHVIKSHGAKAAIQINHGGQGMRKRVDVKRPILAHAQAFDTLTEAPRASCSRSAALSALAAISR